MARQYMHDQTDANNSIVSPASQTQYTQSSVQVCNHLKCSVEPSPSLSLTGMRMLSHSSLVGVDEGSLSATAAAVPLLVALAPASSASTATTARWAWTASQAQAQLTPDGRISTTTGFVDVHRGLILAALLCGLVGAVSLHSLLRCALQYYCARRRRAQLAGLKESALRRMPVVMYEAGAPAAGAECAICLGEFEDGDAVRLLPRCRHGFHVRCIDTWLSAHSSCPICRDSLLDEGATAAAEATVAGEGTQRRAAAWISPEFTTAMLLLA